MAFPDNFTAERRELDVSKYVYHYTSRDVAIPHILGTRKLKLGALRQTNDPRESKSWSFGISARESGPPQSQAGRLAEIERFVKVVDTATRVIQGNCKVLCTTMDDPEYSPTDMHEFRRGFGHSRMWAQYGEAHKGVCLIFNRQLLHEAIEHELAARGTIYHGPVEYSDDVGKQLLARALTEDELVQSDLENVLRGHRHRHYRTFFFAKSNDWSQEFEYRWVVIGQDDEPEFVSIDRAIAGVVVGCDFARVYLPSLIPLCKSLGIPGAKMSWEDGIPLLPERFV